MQLRKVNQRSSPLHPSRQTGDKVRHVCVATCRMGKYTSPPCSDGRLYVHIAGASRSTGDPGCRKMATLRMARQTWRHRCRDDESFVRNSQNKALNFLIRSTAGRQQIQGYPPTAMLVYGRIGANVYVQTPKTAGEDTRDLDTMSCVDESCSFPHHIDSLGQTPFETGNNV